MAELDHRQRGAALVERLIRSCRDDAGAYSRRVTQDCFLTLIVKRGEGYAADLNRSNIYRWESGRRLPPRELLLALGRTLKVPGSEMDRMLCLAGCD